MLDNVRVINFLLLLITTVIKRRCHSKPLHPIQYVNDTHPILSGHAVQRYDLQSSNMKQY